MKTNLELIDELSKIRSLSDKLLLEIGNLSTQYFFSNKFDLKEEINRKVEIYKKVEQRLVQLEKEISNNKE
jgi:hypothetical protein